MLLYGIGMFRKSKFVHRTDIKKVLVILKFGLTLMILHAA